MFEISRDMFNKNIERALTVYVIPMPDVLLSILYRNITSTDKAHYLKNFKIGTIYSLSG